MNSSMDDTELRRYLAQLAPAARDVLRRAARAEQVERDGLAYGLEREPGGAHLADLIDLLSLNVDARRQVVRVLGGLEAR